MFKNVGRDIKNLVKTIANVRIGISILLGMIVFLCGIVMNRVFLGLVVGAVIIGVGWFNAWFASLKDYAYGEMADRLIRIDEKMERQQNILASVNADVASKPTEPIKRPGINDWYCMSCGSLNNSYAKYCSKCGGTAHQ